MGPIAVAARAIAGDAIDKSAINTNGFRFGKVLNYRDVDFLPGGSKYLDLPGMLITVPTKPLWLAGETNLPPFVAEVFKNGSSQALELYSGEKSAEETAAVNWLLK
jgi:hypothetical protein